MAKPILDQKTLSEKNTKIICGKLRIKNNFSYFVAINITDKTKSYEHSGKGYQF